MTGFTISRRQFLLRGSALLSAVPGTPVPQRAAAAGRSYGSNTYGGETYGGASTPTTVGLLTQRVERPGGLVGVAIAGTLLTASLVLHFRNRGTGESG